MEEKRDSLVQKALDTYLRKKPTLGRDVYIAQGAVVVGDVRIGDHASIWYNAVVRADIQFIEIGAYSNVQDNVVLHVTEELPCRIGEWVTIGHAATVHACTVGDEVLIGIGAVVLDGAEIGPRSIIGAQALVPPGMKVPEGSLVLGVPGKVVRTLSREEQAKVRSWAEPYVANAAYYLRHRIGLHPLCQGRSPVQESKSSPPSS